MNPVKSTVDRLNTLLLLLLTINLVGCQPPSTSDASQASGESRLETQLVLNNAVLEQSNKQDNTIWKIKADRIEYSEDKQIATLTKVVGNLWYKGTIILKISAETGEIRNNGNIILLNDRIIVQDPRNGSIINSEAVEWRPQKNLLLITKQLTGVRPNLEVTADSGKYFTDLEKLEIEGNVVATTNQPSLQLSSDRLEWNIAGEQIVIPDPVEIVRYNQDETITDKLVGDRARLNLVEHTATFKGNIELITLEPQLQIATDALIWNYQDRIGRSDRPVQILDRNRQISLTGNQGEINFPQQLATLQNGAKGVNQRQKSELYARQIIWKIDTEEVEAIGNIVFEQVDPKVRLTGEKAQGTLGNNEIVVTSDGKQQVTSVIEE